MRHIIVVGDMKTGEKEDLLITHSLGSCLGLIVYDPEIKIGGLLHAMLPLSKINRDKAQTNPYMFVDTGVSTLFKTLYEMGAKKSRLVVKAAGCGNPMGRNETFKIGERNYSALKMLLQKSNILLEAEDIGGTKSRTVNFDILSGITIISSNGQKEEL
ncbi:MAG: chemotaxis protein CheD [Thermodesulfobacteriota bacterium]|nr:chemotaxis protein CheD [Thermodesulfobacteriota bacterium]